LYIYLFTYGHFIFCRGTDNSPKNQGCQCQGTKDRVSHGFLPNLSIPRLFREQSGYSSVWGQSTPVPA
jgi:hypothetical protein